MGSVIQLARFNQGARWSIGEGLKHGNPVRGGGGGGVGCGGVACGGWRKGPGPVTGKGPGMGVGGEVGWAGNRKYPNPVAISTSRKIRTTSRR